MKTKLIAATFVFAATLLAQSAKAVPVSVSNFNFEDSFTGATITGPIPSWTENPVESGSLGVFNFAGVISPSQSSNSAGGDIGSAFMNINASISQTTSHVISAFETFTLQVDLGDRDDNTGATFAISLYKDSIVNILDTTVFDTNTLFPLAGDTGWAENVTVSYQASPADAGSLIGILIAKTGGNASAVDNVRLDAQELVVPEPSTFALLGLGAFGLVRHTRRRRRRA